MTSLPIQLTVGPDALATRCDGEVEAIGTVTCERIDLVRSGVGLASMSLRESVALAYELLALAANGARTYKP